MHDLRIESLRGGQVESVHLVSVAVVDPSGALIAAAGRPDLVSFWRSAAKPFQAIPLIADGAADHFGFGLSEVALACASHSSEPVHLAVVERMLQAIGLEESALACGAHVPLSPVVARSVARLDTALTARWSNCSGKHAGMLALARHHGWNHLGYEREGHPVQRRCLEEVARWSGIPIERIGLGVDGCAALCFALPLHAMALAYARLGTSDDAAAARIRAAMTGRPDLVAGQGRLCTELMAAIPGRVIAKVGAQGVYGAVLLEERLGVALKIEDGDGDAAEVALLAVLTALGGRLGGGPGASGWPSSLGARAEPAVTNTRGSVVGRIRAIGSLRFSA